ncbi:very short patch repair endonuclease [Roseomonas aerophila]|uniref:Very short patch repair endonuclease n=1 Tax=Teichococcus aerophilus TaxID=1224513 RepID=A0ABR7RT60_9PROT|nr:very short patch repair endonuclease [Pseudoroseomonas aerophila]MBC9209824.1 very short patch repair endonuclease [Pseudoroseomonas aerophila]
MVDTRTPEQRRRIMQAVKTEHTGPEWIVRRWLHAHGYRYRLHSRDLPGRPDIVFPGRRVAVFVHGCFWHSHDCAKGRAPKSRLDYWGPKLEANRRRDALKRAELEALGWTVLTVWQCETTDPTMLAAKLTSTLDATESRSTRPRKSAIVASNS